MNKVIFGFLLFLGCSLFWGLITPFIGARLTAHPVFSCYASGFFRNVLAVASFLIIYTVLKNGGLM